MIIMIPINGYIAAKTRKLQVTHIFSFERCLTLDAGTVFINWLND